MMRRVTTEEHIDCDVCGARNVVPTREIEVPTGAPEDDPLSASFARVRVEGLVEHQSDGGDLCADCAREALKKAVEAVRPRTCR